MKINKTVIIFLIFLYDLKSFVKNKSIINFGNSLFAI